MYHQELRNRKIISDGKKSCSSIPNCFMTNKDQFTECRNNFKNWLLFKLKDKFRESLAGKSDLDLQWNGERNMKGTKIGDAWILVNVPQILNVRIIEELKILVPDTIIDETDNNSMTLHNMNHNTININFCTELKPVTIFDSIKLIVSNMFRIYGLVVLLCFVLAIIGAIDHYMIPRGINHSDPCSYISFPFIKLPIVSSLCKTFVCPILSGMSYNQGFIDTCQQHFVLNL